jgi:hypothetical protein
MKSLNSSLAVGYVISTLKLYIIEEFNNIPQEMIKKSCRSVIDCLKHCLENNGQHFYLTYR